MGVCRAAFTRQYQPAAPTHRLTERHRAFTQEFNAFSLLKHFSQLFVSEKIEPLNEQVTAP